MALFVVDVDGIKSETDRYGAELPASWRTGPEPIISHMESGHVLLIGPRLSALWQVTMETVPQVHGWTTGSPGPWVTYSRGTVRVPMGFWALMGGAAPEKEWPLFGDLVKESDLEIPESVFHRFAMWSNLLGMTYHGSPGVAGTAMLRLLYPHGKPPRPLWHLPVTPALDRAGEAELHWRSPVARPHVHAVTYDRRRAYLASALSVEVAAGALEHNPVPGQQFDPGRSGWWKIDPSPWQFHAGLPDPLDGMHALGGIWVTTPTLRLLTELRELGIYGGYRILESRTGRSTRLLRPWAERIRDAEAAMSGRTDKAALALAATLKESYRRAIGLMSRTGGPIWRPDWQAAIIAHTRMQVCRQTIKTYRLTGHLPVRIDVDSISYAMPTPVAEVYADELKIRLTPHIGGWRIPPQRTRPRRATRAAAGVRRA